MPTPKRLGLWWAAQRFRQHRADFYEYLADIIEAVEGRKTIKPILITYANRHGTHTARGRLAAHWAARIEDSGDLGDALADTMPAFDVTMITLLQGIGGAALTGGLRDLAALLRLTQNTVKTFVLTMLAAFFGLAIALLSTALLPTAIVPQLRQSFHDVPPDLYGMVTRTLFAYSDFIGAQWLLLALVGAALLAAFAWSLPNWRGAWRDRADRFGLYALYRNLKAIQCLVTLAILVQPRRAAHNIGFRDALRLLGEQASPWQNAHVQRMRARLEEGHSGAATFQTGMLDPDTYAYLEDMDDALGMNQALQKIRPRLEDRALRRVEQQATFWRWAILLACLGYGLSIYAATMLVIAEMRSGLLLSTGF